MVEKPASMRQTSPEYLLLGMLSLAPSHGYDLHQQIERDLRNVWNISLSQVYNVLTRLEKQGLIQGEIQAQEERPDRKHYHVTPSGSRHLHTWFETPVGPSVHAVRIAFIGKLYLAQQLPEIDLVGLIEKQRASIQDGLQHLQSRLKANPIEDPIQRQSLQLKALVLKTVLDWLGECQDVLSKT